MNADSWKLIGIDEHEGFEQNKVDFRKLGGSVMDYITRSLEKVVLKASGQYSVVIVCGQRQTGKSTMLRHIAESDRVYVSFDKAETRRLAQNDTAGGF